MWLMMGLLLGQTIIQVFCTASHTYMCLMMGFLLGYTVVQFFHIASHTHLQRRQTHLVTYQDLTEVEVRINELTGAVQELKETRNSLTPLFKLPVELVIIVLSLLVAGDEPDARSLVSCSQVCRRMRQICLEYPCLWRDAMNMSACPKLMAMILQRSAPLPFSIAIDFAQWNAEDPQMPNCATNLGLVASALHRLDNFHIHASPSVVSAVISQFPHRAPTLETLYLGVSRMMGDSDHILQVPDALMMLDAPLLRKLCLYGCIFSWDKFTFTKLVELRVVGFPNEVKPSLTAVLLVLSNLPFLQTLVMREVLLKLDNTLEQHAEPVQLPCLQSLCIHCPAVDCAIFLDAIATKELRVLDLVCQDTAQNTTAAEMIKFYSALQVKTRAMDVRSVSMHCDFNNVRLIGSTFTDANCEDAQAIIMVEFHFTQTQSTDNVVRRLITFTKGIAASRVQCVRLHMDAIYGADTDDVLWHTVLSPFSSVTHLHLSQPLRFKILSCLLNNARRAIRLAGIDPTQSFILLPLLSILDTSSEPDGVETELIQQLLYEISVQRGMCMTASGESRDIALY